MTKYGIAFIKTNSCEEDDGIYDICGLTFDFLEKPKRRLLKMMNVSIKFCNTESRLTCLTH